MYLTRLDNDKRHLFLDLELYMSRIDGDFSDQEKQIIDVHCREMHIDHNNYMCELPLDDVYARIRETMTPQEKRIVFLELTATIMADNVYHEKEKEMVEKLSSILDINDEQEKTAFSIIEDAKAVYERCAAFVQ